MDFIYYGETNIYHEGLDRFLTLAQELQLKGLARSEDASLDAPEEALAEPKHPQCNQSLIPKQENQIQSKDKADIGVQNNSMVAADDDKIRFAADLRVKLDSLMERAADGEHVWKCTVCGKSTKGNNARSHMRGHIEIHMEGLSYPCNQCDKICRSSNALIMRLITHNSRKHRMSIISF